MEQRGRSQDCIHIASFFQLPRELRDEICDLVVLKPRTTYYNIALEANKQPKKTAYVTIRGGSQFDVKLAAAAQRRVKLFLLASDRSGLQLFGPDPRQDWRNREREFKVEQH